MNSNKMFTEAKETNGVGEIKLEQTNSALFCFDFDQTISSEHIQNKIKLAIRKDPSVENDEKKQWAIAEIYNPRATPNKWKETFEKINNDGHQIAITSINDYPKIIRRYLKEKIGLSEQLLEKIFISSCSSKALADKNIHIDQAIDFFKRNRRDRNVVLVDDGEEYITAAKHKLHPEGAVYATIYDVGDVFLNKVVQLSEKLKNEFTQQAGKKLEDEAKKIVLEIKKRIIQTNWPVTGFFGSVGGDIIRLDDESPKSVPKNVRLQWLEIRAAEVGNKPFSQALVEIKRIGSVAASETNYWRDVKITQAYYDLFLETKQQEFNGAFRMGQ